MSKLTIEAEPYPLELEPGSTALLVIDMQRDFLEPGGFGELLGNDVSLLRTTIAPCRAVLDAARARGLLVVHTREGHRPDLADAPPSKLARGRLTTGIGDNGPMGRVLVRGEPGHEIIAELAPRDDEPVIDKPGKGAFYETDLDLILANRGVRTLIVCGITTEVCVHTTVRQANDRGYECLVPADCVGSYFPEFQRVGLEMIKAQGGIFGWGHGLRPAPGGARRGSLIAGPHAAVIRQIITLGHVYRDSITLMQLSASLAALEGVTNASAVMGTEANLGLLADAGLADATVAPAPDALLLAVEAVDEAAMQAAVAQARRALDDGCARSAAVFCRRRPGLAQPRDGP